MKTSEMKIFTVILKSSSAYFYIHSIKSYKKILDILEKNRTMNFLRFYVMKINYVVKFVIPIGAFSAY